MILLSCFIVITIVNNQPEISNYEEYRLPHEHSETNSDDHIDEVLVQYFIRLPQYCTATVCPWCNIIQVRT